MAITCSRLSPRRRTPDWLRQLPAAEMLRRVWVQQFYLGDGRVRWRTERDGIPPAARFVSSPYDADAHYARKGSTTWIGYKAHLSETCDEGLPRVITEVQTTAGPVADGDVTTPLHRALQGKGLLPTQHIVDTGYLSAGLLVETQRDFGIDLVGPARADFRWQSQAGKGFAMDAFAIDWDAQRVTCPMGIHSSGWTPAVDNRGTPVIKVKFSAKDCRACAHRSDCAGPTAMRRLMTFRTRDEYIALQAARQRQKTPEFIGTLRSPGRGRGHHITGRPRLRPAAIPLLRAGQDASSACRHRRRHEPRAPRSLDQRRDLGSHQAVALLTTGPRPSQSTDFASRVRSRGEPASGPPLSVFRAADRHLWCVRVSTHCGSSLAVGLACAGAFLLGHILRRRRTQMAETNKPPDPSWTPRITKRLKCLAESGKIPARGTTPRRVLENSLVYGLDGECEVSGPLRTTRNLRLGWA